MRVVLYLRVSTTEQELEGYSLAGQLSTLKQYASSFGYQIVKIYEDAGISGKNIKDRPALLELIEDAKQKKFDSVLVWKLSRLSRSLLDLLSIVDMLSHNNISFQSYSEKFDTSTPVGKMLLHMLGSIAEFERNTIVENVKMGLGERFKQGYSKGAIPFGYRSEDKKAVIVPEQAEAVKKAFEMFIQEPGNVTDIANYFNLNNLKTRIGGNWNRNTVKDLLKNIFYAGYVRTGILSHGYRLNNAAEIPGQHEPIISIETYMKAKAILDSNKKSVIRNPDNDSIFTGLVICPRCGGTMYALNTYNKHKNKDGTVVKKEIRIYRCTSADRANNRCKGFYIAANKIEDKAKELLFNQTIANIKKLVNDTNKIQLKNSTVDKVKLIEKNMHDMVALRDKYVKAFERSGNKEDFYMDKINDCLFKIDELKEQRKKEISIEIKPVDPHLLNKSIGQLSQVFNKLSNRGKKEALRELIKSVIIGEDKQFKGLWLNSGIYLSYL